MPFDMKAELRRPVALALAAIAVLGWVLFAYMASSRTSQGQRDRGELRELANARQSTATELTQLRQNAGSLAELQAKTAGATEQLNAANTASEQAKAQLRAVQKDIDTRLQQQAELAQRKFRLRGKTLSNGSRQQRTS